MTMSHTYKKRLEFFISQRVSAYFHTLAKNNTLYRKNKEITRSIPKHITLHMKHLLHCTQYTVEQRAKRLYAAFQKLVIKHNKANCADLSVTVL